MVRVFPSVAGRRRAGDEDELPLAGLPRAVHGGEADLRDVVALEDEVVPAEAQARRDVDNRPHRHALGNLDVRDHLPGERRSRHKPERVAEG